MVKRQHLLVEVNHPRNQVVVNPRLPLEDRQRLLEVKITMAPVREVANNLQALEVTLNRYLLRIINNHLRLEEAHKLRAQ